MAQTRTTCTVVSLSQHRARVIVEAGEATSRGGRFSRSVLAPPDPRVAVVAGGAVGKPERCRDSLPPARRHVFGGLRSSIRLERLEALPGRLLPPNPTVPRTVGRCTACRRSDGRVGFGAAKDGLSERRFRARLPPDSLHQAAVLILRSSMVRPSAVAFAGDDSARQVAGSANVRSQPEHPYRPLYVMAPLCPRWTRRR